MVGKEYLGEAAGFVQDVDCFKSLFDWSCSVGAV